LACAIVATTVADLPSDTPAHLALLVFALYLTLGLGLIAAAFIDLEHMYIPDAITLGGALLGVASAGVRPSIDYMSSLVGAVVGFLMIWFPFDWLYRKLRGKTGMAMGDAKLVMLAGAWFGLPGAVFALLAGAIQGTIAAIVTFVLAGSIDEPKAVTEERRAMQQAIANAEGEERAQLMAEFEQDPIAKQVEPGLLAARLAFGPFLALASLEYLFFGQVLLYELFGFYV
jgi:leader peptidase (prepilin peptidase)/N-methyltransferase